MKRLVLIATTLLTAVGVVGCADTTAPDTSAAARAAASKQQLESVTRTPSGAIASN